MKKIALLSLFAVAAVPAFAQEQGSTLWVGTSLMYELPQNAAGAQTTFSFGFSGLLLETDRAVFGPAVDLFWYREPSRTGLAFMGRLGIAGEGAYVAPGIFFVGGGNEKFNFRAGLMVPLGNRDIRRFLPEVNVGFKF